MKIPKKYNLEKTGNISVYRYEKNRVLRIIIITISRIIITNSYNANDGYIQEGERLVNIK